MQSRRDGCFHRGIFRVCVAGLLEEIKTLSDQYTDMVLTFVSVFVTNIAKCFVFHVFRVFPLNSDTDFEKNV